MALSLGRVVPGLVRKDGMEMTSSMLRTAAELAGIGMLGDLVVRLDIVEYWLAKRKLLGCVNLYRFTFSVSPE